jgi:excisionase family DNA binding protein
MSYLTREEVAEMFRVDKRTVDRWLKKGDLKGFKFGKGQTAPIRISQKEVESFLKKSTIKHG